MFLRYELLLLEFEREEKECGLYLGLLLLPLLPLLLLEAAKIALTVGWSGSHSHVASKSIRVGINGGGRVFDLGPASVKMAT